MAKNYTDELAEWIEKQSLQGRGRKLAAFHGVADDVRAALDAGYSVRTIWTNMHEKQRVDCRYETFLRYVNRLIRTDGSPRPGVRSAGSLAAAATPAPPYPPAPSVKRDGMPTFKFNPVPTNREEAK